METRSDSERPRAMKFVALASCVLALWIAACSSPGTAAKPSPTPSAKPTAAPPASSATTPAPIAATTPSPAPDPIPAPLLNACAPNTNCYESGNFAATVANFRTSVVSGYRVIDATLRFQNKTAKPLTIGYVLSSGVAVDEKGNRYAVGGPNGYRGIGYVNGQNIDPKFVVQPGSFGDARFELLWLPGNAIVGSTFELDLTVTEINTIAGNQHTLGGEIPMTFRDLVNEAPAPTRK